MTPAPQPPPYNKQEKSHTHHSLNKTTSVNTTGNTTITHTVRWWHYKDWHACAHPRVLTITSTTEHTQKIGLQYYHRQGQDDFLVVV